LSEEPAFDWWVRHVLRKRDRIINKFKSSYLRKTHNYGIEIPKTVAQAIQLDINNGNTFWKDAIEK
jgi:hypothetical protein